MDHPEDRAHDGQRDGDTKPDLDGKFIMFFALIGLHQLLDQVGLSKMDSLNLLVDCQGPVLHQSKLNWKTKCGHWALGENLRH